MDCLSLRDLSGTIKPVVDDELDERSAHKENMFEGYMFSPRLKAEPIDLSKKCFTPERFPVTPVKIIDRPQAEPWTPTANLKMLISAASPDIRDREKKKDLLRPIENNEPEDVCSDFQFEVADDLDELEKRPSRKQKSLGLLCQKFLARYPSHPMSTEKTNISLDEAASSLGVERRRIYDIVNVLESLHLVSRIAKNQYCWNGQSNLNDTLKKLQIDGEKLKYGELISCSQHKDSCTQHQCGKQKAIMENQTINLPELSEADCPSASASSRKDKSLRIMSKKFVMLFLASKTKIITLELAAKILIEESQDSTDHSKFKTKVRRLYDIANVLTSLRLIKKVHVLEERGRKPAFKWIGPVDFGPDLDQKMEVTSTTPSPNSKRGSCLVFPTFKKVQSSSTVKRKICPESSSICGLFQNVGVHSSDAYSTKMSHMTGDDAKTNPPSVGPLPFSVVPVDPECHFNPVALPSYEQSYREPNGHGFLQNQKYLYLPSSSVVMLCKNSMQEPNRTTSPTPDQVHAYKHLEQLKKRRIGADDSPLSLVQPKETFHPQRSQSPVQKHKTNMVESLQNETENINLGCDRAAHEHLKRHYIYVPSSELNHLQIFLPSGATGGFGTPQNNFASLNVPYVIVPTTALTNLPFFCSHAVPNALPSQSGSLPPNSCCMNYNLPCGSPLGSLPIPALSVPASKHESLDMRQDKYTMSASPVPASCASSLGSNSHACMDHPALASHKPLSLSPTPSTPKSNSPVYKDTFFKTPGSMQQTLPSQKSKTSKPRRSSSAQRRLDISSSAGD
uniref:Transcription factor E2F7 n=1 Tax=Leptobrachium leishanense TaxID=445787 RepID=A0A8C5M2G7_9ANUR